MFTKFGVVVGTFGSEEWRERGQQTISQARQQVPWAEWMHVHSQDLGSARNSGARYLTLARDVDYLIFLDADDSLSGNYLLEMQDAINGPGIYRPSTLGVYPDGSEDDFPVMIPRTHMGAGNCIVVGAACPARLFESVGGFDTKLAALEDWDLWIKMILAGAKVYDVPKAVYRVGVNEDSRNGGYAHGDSYRVIRKRYGSQRGKLDIR